MAPTKKKAKRTTGPGTSTKADSSEDEEATFSDTNIQHKHHASKPTNNDSTEEQTETTTETTTPAATTQSASINNNALPTGVTTTPKIKKTKPEINKVSPNAKQLGIDPDTLPKEVATILYILTLRSDDIIALPERKNHPEIPPYLATLENMFQWDPSLMTHGAKCDFVANQRHPGDPTSYYSRNSPKGSNPVKRLLFVFNVINPSDNTAAYRAHLGRRLVRFINHNATQQKFRFPQLCHYGGDLTSLDDSPEDRPYMSTYLTIADTLEYMSTNPFCNFSKEDLVKNNDIMAQYFHPDMIPKAKEWILGKQSTKIETVTLADYADLSE